MNNDWIEWNGEEWSPVPLGTLIDVKYRNGAENYHVEACINTCATGSMPALNAYDWTHSNHDRDIIAYRLHKPEQQEALLTEQLRKAIAKRDKRAAKAKRNAEKLSAREADVQRLIGELERYIEEATGLSCKIGYQETLTHCQVLKPGLNSYNIQFKELPPSNDIPEGVDPNDPKTWLEGDVIECTMAGEFSDGNPIPFTKGQNYSFDGIDGGGDVAVKENDKGYWDSFYSGRLKFRFVRRPS